MRETLIKGLVSVRKNLLNIFPKKRYPFLGKMYKRIFSSLSPHTVHAEGFTIFFDHKEAADFFTSPYEEEEVKIFKQIIKPGWIVLDGGANIGYHTLVFSKLAKEVYAFEPSPKNFHFLQKNISYNGVQNVHAFRAALDREKGEAVLETTDEQGHPLASGSYYMSALNDKTGERVPTVRGDDYKIRFNFIKLDIEGHELKALQGMQEILKRKPILVVEFNSSALERAGENPEKLLAFLVKYGYSFYDIKEGKHAEKTALLKEYASAHTNLLCR